MKTKQQFTWRFVVGANVVVLLTFYCQESSAQVDRGPEPGQVTLTAEAATAVESGLRYLAQRQREDGTFGTTGYSKNVAVCSLAGMAFLSEGSTPGRGRYGENIDRIVRFLLSDRISKESGFITYEPSASHGPMYGHGFATLFLAEVHGMSHEPELGSKLNAAVRLIVSTQNENGGWRYQPTIQQADISVTVCQVMALRAARNAGIHVPKETIEKSINFVRRCQVDDGGFAYMLTDQKSVFPRSAAAVVALYSAGIYEGTDIESALDYIERFRPRGKEVSRHSNFFYGHYYAVQAMWHAGSTRWQGWYPAVRDAIVARQRDGGEWMDSICPEYGTAMACIILQMPNNFLPIFQR